MKSLWQSNRLLTLDAVPSDAAERKTTGKLLAPTKTSDKIYQIDSHISAVVAGMSLLSDTRETMTSRGGLTGRWSLMLLQA